MTAGLTVAVDAMSGDHGAEVAVPAALDVLASTPDLRLIIVGRGEVVLPLLGAALDNALRIGDQALTGPVARGDAGTVGAHLRAMAQAGERLSPDVAPAYRAMARATADRALADGRLRPQDAEALLVLLAEPGARP
jgi:predicted short-subunit dehydrogenase-like oxidoreductase (DUF2520 family)